MKKGKVLVVDDDLDILEVIGIILDSEGFETDLVSNGMEVFAHISDFKPDLIILDVMLGNMDGREICNVIKSTGETKNIPVIMISASHHASQNSQVHCHPDDFIEKPFDITQLVSTVEHKISA